MHPCSPCAVTCSSNRLPPRWMPVGHELTIREPVHPTAIASILRCIRQPVLVSPSIQTIPRRGWTRRPQSLNVLCNDRIDSPDDSEPPPRNTRPSCHDANNNGKDYITKATTTSTTTTTTMTTKQQQGIEGAGGKVGR